MDDQTIKKLLFERSEAALGEIAKKYSNLYRSIVREAVSDKCDIDECENDILLAIWDSIPPNDPKSLSAYICTIARRIGINKYRHNSCKKRGSGYTLMLSELDDCIPDENEHTDSSTNCRSDDINKILSEFLNSLDAETRVLFVRRYIFFESVSSLAERFEISENSISVKLFRARKKLKNMLRKEDIHI